MYQTECTYNLFVVEVWVIGSYLFACKLTFVDNYFVGEGCDIKSNGILLDAVVDQMTCIVPQHKKLSFKSHRVGDMVWAGNENLFNFRLNRTSSKADVFRVDGNFSPRKYLKAKLFCGSAKDVSAFFPQSYFPWKENRTDSVTTKSRKMNPHFKALIKKEGMGCLDQDTGTISSIAFASTGTPVFHIFKNGEGIRNHLVVFVSFDVGDKANTTCISFEFRTV